MLRFSAIEFGLSGSFWFCYFFFDCCRQQRYCCCWCCCCCCLAVFMCKQLIRWLFGINVCLCNFSPIGLSLSPFFFCCCCCYWLVFFSPSFNLIGWILLLLIKVLAYSSIIFRIVQWFYQYFFLLLLAGMLLDFPLKQVFVELFCLSAPIVYDVRACMRLMYTVTSFNKRQHQEKQIKINP